MTWGWRKEATQWRPIEAKRRRARLEPVLHPQAALAAATEAAIVTRVRARSGRWSSTWSARPDDPGWRASQSPSAASMAATVGPTPWAVDAALAAGSFRGSVPASVARRAGAGPDLDEFAGEAGALTSRLATRSPAPRPRREPVPRPVPGRSTPAPTPGSFRRRRRLPPRQSQPPHRAARRGRSSRPRPRPEPGAGRTRSSRPTPPPRPIRPRS